MSQTSTQPSGPGRPKDPAKHNAILEAAKTLFMCHGYDGVSMDAIAAEAGVSKLTVYSHFTDKETLYSEAVKAKCDEQLPQLLGSNADQQPLPEQLLAIAKGFHTLVNSAESVQMHRLMINLGNQQSSLTQIFYDAGPKRVLEQLEALLMRAVQRGELCIDNPAQAADHFVCLVKGCAHFRLLIGCAQPLDGYAAEQHVAEAVRVFLRAYRP